MTTTAIAAPEPLGRLAWLLVTEAAALARCSTRTVRRWVVEGRLRASRPGGRIWLVCREDLERLLEASSNMPAEME